MNQVIETPPHLVSKANRLGPRVDEQLLSKEQTGALCLQGRVGLYTAWDTKVLPEAVTWTCPEAFNPQSCCGPSLTAQQQFPRLRALHSSSLRDPQRNRLQPSSFTFRVQDPRPLSLDPGVHALSIYPQIQGPRTQPFSLRPKLPEPSPPSDLGVQTITYYCPRNFGNSHNFGLGFCPQH